jgi:hypothetical protein
MNVSLVQVKLIPSHQKIRPLEFLLIPQKHAGTHYTEVVFLHPVGFVGHIMHFVASSARNVDTLFCMPG